MRFVFSIIVFVFYMTDCYCGIIHNVHHLKLEQDNGKTRERRAEEEVNYSGGGSEVSEDVPENCSLMHDLNAATESLDSTPSIKKKRCPRDNVVGSVRNTNLDAIVGASPPLDEKIRGIQDGMSKKICSVCLTRCTLIPSTCPRCENYCTPEEIASSAVKAKEGVVGSTLEENTEMQRTTDPTVSLKNRFADVEPSEMKRVYTIATLKSGQLKEVICKLLGISDTSDIDAVVVWVTTKSNKPPEFTPGYNKQVSLKTEILTKKLNNELNDRLKKKVQQGGNALTNKDIEGAISRIFYSPRNGPKQVTKPHNKERTSDFSMEDEDSPDSNSDLTSPSSFAPVNPELIEGSPYMKLGEQPPKNIVDVPTEPRIGQAKTEDSSPPELEIPVIEEDSDEKIAAAAPEEKEPEPFRNDVMAVGTPSDVNEKMLKPENENAEVQNENKPMADVDKIRTNWRNNKYKEIYTTQHYPQNYRTNADTDETITGMSPNVEDKGSNIPETESQRNLDEHISSTNLIPETNQRGSQDDIIGTETGDNIIGVSENKQNEPQPGEKLNQSSANINQEPALDNAGITQTQEVSQYPGAPIAKNKNDVPRLGSPLPNYEDSSSKPNIVGSSIAQASSSEVFQSPEFSSKLNKENQQNTVQEMPPQQPVGAGSHENSGVIVSPNMQSEEDPEDDSTSLFSSFEEEERMTKAQDHTSGIDRVGSLRNTDLPDRKSQQLSPVKFQSPVDSQTATPITKVDNFDKAAAVLKDVEKLVHTIQKATQTDSEKRLLGEEQPVVGMKQDEQNIEFPTSTTATESDRIETPQHLSTGSILSSSPQRTSGPMEVVESETAPQIVKQNTDDPFRKETSSPKLDSDRLGSQPLESVPWDRDTHRPIFKPLRPNEQTRSNFKKNYNAGRGSPQPVHESSIPREQSSDLNIVNMSDQDIIKDGSVLGTPQNTPDMENRGEFSPKSDTSQQSLWSNALGKFVPTGQHKGKESNDIYFIGNGIKLPLQMVRKDDGAMHLSVDLDKMCSCKNFSCPKNHTAIEETVGTILEKEAELKDQLTGTNLDGNNLDENNHESLDNLQLGIAKPAINEEIDIVSNRDTEGSMSSNRNEREVMDNNILEMKNSIAEQKNSDSDVHIFKRSVNQEELNASPKFKIAHDKVLSLIENAIINNTANIMGNNEERGITKQVKITTVEPVILEPKSNANKKPVNSNKSNAENLTASNPFPNYAPSTSVDDTSNYVRQLINKKLTEVRSKMSDIERRNELKNKQMLLSQEKLKNIFNTVSSPAVYDPSGISDSKMTTDDIEDKTWEYILKQSPINGQIQSLNDNVNNNILISPNSLTYKSVMKDLLERKIKGDEIYDEVTPVKNPYQLKSLNELENGLETFNDYATRDGTMIKKEARMLLNKHVDDVIQQEVAIMNNILTWLKNVTVNNR